MLAKLEPMLNNVSYEGPISYVFEAIRNARYFAGVSETARDNDLSTH